MAADTTPKDKGDEIGPLSHADEQALDRAWSRITPADIARSKQRLQELKAIKKKARKAHSQS